MNVLLRKLRGVVATGLIWSPVWAALFAVLLSLVAIFAPIRGDVGPIYRDRALVPHGPPKIAAAAGQSVTFQHALVVDGRIAGTWRVLRGAQGVSISVTPLRRLTASEQRGVTPAALRYERFLGIPVAVTMG